MSVHSGRSVRSDTQSRSFASSLYRSIVNFHSNAATLFSQAQTSLSRSARSLWSRAPTAEKMSSWYSRYRVMGDKMGMTEVSTAVKQAAEDWAVNEGYT